jgi:hypothetical protein
VVEVVTVVDQTEGCAQRQHGTDGHRNDEDQRAPVQQRIHYTSSHQVSFLNG